MSALNIVNGSVGLHVGGEGGAMQEKKNAELPFRKKIVCWKNTEFGLE